MIINRAPALGGRGGPRVSEALSVQSARGPGQPPARLALRRRLSGPLLMRAEAFRAPQ